MGHKEQDCAISAKIRGLHVRPRRSKWTEGVRGPEQGSYKRMCMEIMATVKSCQDLFLNNLFHSLWMWIRGSHKLHRQKLDDALFPE
jgi:hypothetical protein